MLANCCRIAPIGGPAHASICVDGAGISGRTLGRFVTSLHRLNSGEAPNRLSCPSKHVSARRFSAVKETAISSNKLLCLGNTAPFGGVILGSNPSWVATFYEPISRLGNRIFLIRMVMGKNSRSRGFGREKASPLANTLVAT